VLETRDYRDPKTGVALKLRSFRGLVTEKYLDNLPQGWYLLAFYATISNFGSTSHNYNAFDISCVDRDGRSHGTNVVLPLPYNRDAYGNGSINPNRSITGWAGCMYHPHQSVRITWKDENMIQPTTIVRLSAGFSTS
jgi:hypothetical protein